MSIVTIDQQLQRLVIQSFELTNELVFAYFNKLPASERDDALFRCVYIGVLASMEDRLSSFFAKTSNDLGTQLESLKLIFDMKRELFFKTATKGAAAEDEIVDFLNAYFQERRLKDRAQLTGALVGSLPKNKTGDIVCHVDGLEDKRIVIECKFDKSLRLGDIQNRDIFAKKSDTAWSQLLESAVNREGRIAMIVFDIALIDNSILSATDSVAYIAGIGLIAVVDSQKGDYSNLLIAYNLARDIALNSRPYNFDGNTLSLIVNRLLKDIRDYLTIRTLVERTIENSKGILAQLDKTRLSMEFTQTYLQKFLSDGRLTSRDLLDFYFGDEIREKYKPLEQDILALSASAENRNDAK